jgi:hypothetical protein
VVAGKAIVEFSKELHGVSVRGVPLSVKERRRSCPSVGVPDTVILVTFAARAEALYIS